MPVERSCTPLPLRCERVVWEGPSTIERVVEAARRGSGLLLSRVAIGVSDRPTHEVQIPMVEAYRANLPDGVEPRIGLSRTVYPAADPGVPLRDLTAGLQPIIDYMAASGSVPPDLPIEAHFRSNNIHFGSPDQVVASLQAEPLIGEVTDLICQVQPGTPSFESTLDAIELLATEIGPALGWAPAGATAAASR